VGDKFIEIAKLVTPGHSSLPCAYCVTLSAIWASTPGLASARADTSSAKTRFALLPGDDEKRSHFQVVGERLKKLAEF
jgi:hypothetical protein